MNAFMHACMHVFMKGGSVEARHASCCLYVQAMTDYPIAPGSASGRPPKEPLTAMKEWLEHARQDAAERRRELGLPELPADEFAQPRVKKGRRR